MLSKRILQLLLTLCLVTTGAFAQVTTSSITGFVRDDKAQGLQGATVTATHQPSGTVYTTVSKKDGNFNLPGLRIGGPYQLSVTYVGFTTQTVNDIFLQLGTPFSVTVDMTTSAATIGNVTVSAAQRRRLVADKTGAATVIGQRQLTTLPTISRSISDFTKLTPQANGNNFAGRDGRLNNIQVDGANLNNNFGLSNDPLPGGGNQPIALDAYDEIAVNIAPYDVRQGNFTGAGITAVTKSGTNVFRGTAYGYLRTEKMNGARVGSFKLGALSLDKKTNYGIALGGPIIKNKVFFFINADLEKREFPGIAFTPTGGSGLGNVSSTRVDSLKKLSDHLRTKYGYETGAYDNFPNFESKNHKLLGKIDWNINKTHKLTLKYSDFVSENDQTLNATSVPNGGGYVVTGGGTQSRLSQNRFGLQSMSFANSNYRFKDIVRSGAVELNSNFSGKFANQFLATLTKIRTTRTTPSQLFPMIDIYNGSGNNYMSAGYEPFSYNNDVKNDVFNITNNFTYFAGKHTLTAGASYEYQTVGNMFMSASQSHYIYNSLNDFITNQAPVYFAYTYSLVPGKEAVYSAELKIGQLGAYIQDEYNINPKFKLTYGVRIDRPIYNEQPIENPAIKALSFPDQNGVPTNYSTGMWPKAVTYWSPRVGFRYDIKGDKSLVFRGGTGIFTGRLPFVWFTNMPTNSGMYQFGAAITNSTTAGANRLKNFLFNPNVSAYRDSFPSVAGTSVPASIVLIDPNFKFPQVWRTNFALDKQFGNGWSFTLEGIFTKSINDVYMRNANQKPTNGTLANGGDTRGRFVATADRRYYSAISGSAIVLENTKKGYSLNLTAQVSKAFSNGLYGSLSYTMNAVGEVTSNPGSQANSVWNANPTRGTQNDQEMSFSSYAVPHRVMGYVSYRKEYLKHLATTITLFYEGSAQNNFSYIYNGDINNDGNNTTDLMYLPSDLSTINFVNRPAGSGVTAVTAQQQLDAFKVFVANSRYLSKIKNGYTERNAALLPWYHTLNLNFQQDLFTNVGGRRNTLRFTADILNFGNMINRNWGIRKQTTVGNPLQIASVNATTGVPSFWMTQVNGQLPTQPFQDTRSTASTWQMQLGLRYIF